MAILFTITLNNRFKNYLIQENSEIRDELITNFSEYAYKNQTLDQFWLEQFSNVYMEQGMFISINSESGEQIWSCLNNNSAMCDMHIEKNELKDIKNLETKTYEIPIKDTEQNAYLSVSYISPEKYSRNDIFFLGETYKMLLISMIISLIVAAFTAVLLSKSMSRPLENISKFAMRLASHDYSVSDPFKKGTKEIDNLHVSIVQLADSLRNQEKLRKRLTSDISHELRTPLTSIQTYLEAMIDGIWPSNRERLQSCHDEIIRLSGLVDQLDDLHSYDENIKSINRTSVNLKESLTSVFKIFEKDLDLKNIKWEIRCPDIIIEADENRLKQIWINLISNSLKFKSDSGYILVVVDDSNPIKIEFTDNGIGIDKNDMPLIFERFYQADTSRNIEGSGLGLSIVKEIINLHNGDIKVVSKIGNGTKFIIKLPGV
jgi:signal transduction histidine kinase